ncbi:YaaL family protein [Metabacillus sp. JX24]|uniref:YaaL family protein n=1 Tax=Metabacillus sp. JX24 TaxID=3240759 RepID=UPI00350EB524
MFFRKKGWLRKEYDQLLIDDLLHMKSEWNHRKQLVDKSVEPSPEILYELKVSQSKYFFLLREAKKRNITIGKK